MTIFKNVYRFASSMKTGLVLLGLIVLVSALGSGFWPEDFAQSFLFRSLLILLFINMALCTGDRISRFTRISGKARGMNRGWFRLLGIVLLHSGIILILIGGAMNSYLGQSGQLQIVEGETGLVSQVIKTDQPFALKLEKFEITFNNDGSPSQYYSHVNLLEGNQQNNFTISVNHPLQHQAIKAYQESFGYLVEANSTNGPDQPIAKTLKEGEFLEIPGTTRTVKVYKYIPNFDPNYGMDSKTLRPDNPKVIFSVYENGQLLGVGAASFGEQVELDKDIKFSFQGVKPFTVLQVKSDPGLPVTAAGGLMLMTGVCLALFLTPVRKTKMPVRAEDSNDGLHE